MLKIKIGNFDKNKGYSFSIIPMQANLENDHKKYTLEEIGQQLAKELKVKNGEIELLSIDFRYRKSK